MPDFVLALIIKPFVVVGFIFCFAVAKWLAMKLPDNRFRRLLLRRVW